MISGTMASLDVFTTRLSRLIIFKKFGLDPNLNSLTYQDFDPEDDLYVNWIRINIKIKTKGLT